ncbi:phage head-tail joining protein [Methylocystis suflitae]|uniref:phage head-tail joining protein n=1 Tax=Methylocystis suflitae TaxID=2951405 RepID=UPI00210A08B0|nr:hypothetical protein [Methylocystis suflitae]MCQ4191023.1 hypothetical protein [Methylocystis suflitae]
MTDISTLRARLEALKKVRSSGALEITFGDRTIRYRNDRDLATAIAALEDEIAQAVGTPRPRNLVVRSTKGW